MKNGLGDSSILRWENDHCELCYRSPGTGTRSTALIIKVFRASNNPGNQKKGSADSSEDMKMDISKNNDEVEVVNGKSHPQ